MRKVYVPVQADFDTQGRVLPRALTWEDDHQYIIDRILCIQRAASLKVGGTGIRYTVRIGDKETYLWLEDGQRWFVEAKQ